MLTRAGTIALRALVELARHPNSSISCPELANRQNLPAPMLEKLLLHLRRAGLVEATRGRNGGYRLKVPPHELALQAVLNAVGGWRQPRLTQFAPVDAKAAASAGEQLEMQLQQRLLRAMEREMAGLSLAELLYDQRSWEATLDPDGGLMLG